MPIEHNAYFDGDVQSVSSVNTAAAGGKYSVGIISIGTYHFGTASSERMTVINGILSAKFDGEDDSCWVDYPAGTSFVVPANSGFDVKATVDTAYHCEYLE
jgi:uncharacterized protein YaiE (UPF0345 family)